MQTFNIMEVKYGDYVGTPCGVGKVLRVWGDCNDWYVELHLKDGRQGNIPLSRVQCVAERPEFIELYSAKSCCGNQM